MCSGYVRAYIGPVSEQDNTDVFFLNQKHMFWGQLFNIMRWESFWIVAPFGAHKFLGVNNRSWAALRISVALFAGDIEHRMSNQRPKGAEHEVVYSALVN